MPVPIGGSAIVEWGELKQAFLNGYKGGKFSTQDYHAHSKWRKGRKFDREMVAWYGGMTSPDQMAEWLLRGFSSDQFPIDDSYIPQVIGRKMIFSDEGELDLTMAWSGHDFPYLAWTEIPRKPGIRIVAEFGFSGGTSGEAIARYGAWLYGLLQTLETMGYDIELDLSFTTGGQNSTTSYPDENFQTIIRLKREGELSDFSDWSALFSPGGYRILMFLATELAADKLKSKRQFSLGRCNIQTTSVAYDQDTGTLRIEPSQRKGPNIDKLTSLVNDALGIAEELVG